ncbi:MAG: rod shape determining protein RodA [Solirubrobacteraceae bacterium]|jgi:rod shape determining protein RodA|nr:rodA [Solirubrobacterales bacterium]MEA2215866.1 rod shape determining protein RodA [Solirubrobacteraceae bacterium]
MPLSPIRPAEEAPPPPPRALSLPFDPLLMLAVLALGACSVITLGAGASDPASGTPPSYYSSRQTVYLAVGLVLMLGLSRLDYGLLRRYKNALYVALLVSIVAVLGLGHAARGSQRAINFPLFSFQASELGKVLLILALSALVVDRARQLRDRDTTIRVIIAALVPAIFVIAQPDLGSGLVYMVIACMLLFIAGASWRHLAALAALVAVSGAFVLVAAPAAGIHVLKPYQVQRLTAFLHPSSNPQKEGYQQQESKIAIGSGQKTGRGLNSNQTSNGFVPESHTDFIFAAVGERYGFVGAGLVLLLYGLLISRALRVLVMAKDLFGSLIAAGVAAMLMFQVFVNVGMTIGIMPITGVTLPLMSYGGSSVITTMLAVGLLQSIYVRARATAALKGRVPRF